MSDDDQDARGAGRSGVHRALSSPVRTRLLGVLRATDEAHDVQDLAVRLDLHVNTVRAHLAVLEDAALVASSPRPRDRPGRPRLAYRATDEVAELAGRRSYRRLAEVLVAQVESLAADAGRAAESAGRAWGRDLGPDEQGAEGDADAALATVVARLDELGFGPELDRADPERPRILLHQCPFVEVARDHREVVCSLHLGLMRGLLAQLDAPVEVVELTPFVEPTLCVADLVEA